MILKPFMLRRIKKDVENELSDKVEAEKIETACARECSRFRLQHFVRHHARHLVCYPLPRCRTKPRNRPCE